MKQQQQQPSHSSNCSDRQKDTAMTARKRSEGSISASGAAGAFGVYVHLLLQQQALLYVCLMQLLREPCVSWRSWRRKLQRLLQQGSRVLGGPLGPLRYRGPCGLGVCRRGPPRPRPTCCLSRPITRLWGASLRRRRRCSMRPTRSWDRNWGSIPSSEEAGTRQQQNSPGSDAQQHISSVQTPQLRPMHHLRIGNSGFKGFRV